MAKGGAPWEGGLTDWTEGEAGLEHWTPEEVHGVKEDETKEAAGKLNVKVNYSHLCCLSQGYS